MSSPSVFVPRWPRADRATITGGRAAASEHALLVGMVLVAAVIRLLVLDTQSLWADEALTAYETSLPFAAMLHVVTTVEVTPPLYFVVIWGWARVFGHDPAVLRALSAICGIALVPVVFLAARRLVSPRAGLFAAALVTVSPIMVWYSQEARVYMLLTLLCAGALAAFARVWQAPSGRATALWALLASLAVMSHFFAGFAIAPQAVALLWRRRSRATWLACGAVAAVQLAMLPFAIADTAPGKGTGWIAQVPFSHRVSTAIVEWGASTLYRRTTFAAGLAIGAGLLLIVVLAVWRGGDGPQRRGVALVAALAVPVLVVPALLRLAGLDFFLSRNELPAFAAVVIVLAGALALPGVRRSGAVVLTGLLLICAAATLEVQTHPFLQRADWRRVALALGPASGSRAVLAAGGTTAQPLKIYLPGVPWSHPPGAPVLVSEIDVVGATKRLALAGAQRDPSGSPRRRRAAPLPRRQAPPGARLISRRHVANWVVSRFALDRPRAMTVTELTRTAGRWIAHVPRALLIFFQRETG